MYILSRADLVLYMMVGMFTLEFRYKCRQKSFTVCEIRIVDLKIDLVLKYIENPVILTKVKFEMLLVGSHTMKLILQLLEEGNVILEFRSKVTGDG